MVSYNAKQWLRDAKDYLHDGNAQADVSVTYIAMLDKRFEEYANIASYSCSDSIQDACHQSEQYD